jgi:hypothetical protein
MFTGIADYAVYMVIVQGVVDNLPVPAALYQPYPLKRGQVVVDQGYSGSP